MDNLPGKIDDNTAGVFYGFSAFVLWGLLPLYWKLLGAVPALEILAHRILWSFIVVALIIFTLANVGILREPYTIKTDTAEPRG